MEKEIEKRDPYGARVPTELNVELIRKYKPLITKILDKIVANLKQKMRTTTGTNEYYIYDTFLRDFDGFIRHIFVDYHNNPNKIFHCLLPAADKKY